MVFIKLSKNLYDNAISYGYATHDTILKAQKYADDKKCTPQKALVDTAVITEDKLLEFQGLIYNYKIIKDITQINVDKELLQRFDSDKLAKLKMIPITYNNKMFEVMFTNPASSIVIEDYIKEMVGKNVDIDYFLISESVYNKYINSDTTVGIIEYDLDSISSDDMDGENQIYDVTNEDTSTIVTLANTLFFKAARVKSSDIHIEPFDEIMRIRFRVDGILQKVLETPKRVHQKLINRIKTMANMDINNTRNSQGGGIRLKIYGSHIDMRVSTQPTIYGENTVIRLLDKNTLEFNIKIMNLSKDNEKKFRNCIKKPNGVILITGPTGSGKSSSLFSALSELNTEEVCITTIEDPVEYTMHGIIQVPVAPSIDRTFAACLRETLRQDPNIILIGEIRDRETAETAIQASNTGHLIFSTLHTNDAVSAIVRLIEMKIEPFMVSSTLNAIMSQRLVRRICEHCKTKYLLEKNSPYHKILNCGNDEVFLYKGTGCKECGNIGYKGRMAIQEFLVVDNEIRREILQSRDFIKMQEIAIKNGMKTIFEDGIEKALSGFTTLDEVHRILHFDNLE